jgi:hypothetical protein
MSSVTTGIRAAELAGAHVPRRDRFAVRERDQGSSRSTSTQGRVTAIEAVQEDQAAFDELFAGD